MPERRICTFCGAEIEPGTGRMYIKKDGVVYNFCTSKCFKNMVVLGRVARRTTWTRHYEREKGIRMKGAITEEALEPTAKKAENVTAAPEKAEVSEEPVAEKEESGPALEEEKEPEKKPEEKKGPVKKETPAPKKGGPAKKPKPEASSGQKQSEGADE